MKKYTEEKKKDLRDELEKLVSESGLSNNRYALERLGFSNPSKLSHVMNSWDKPGLVGEDTWAQVEKHIQQNTSYKMVFTGNMKEVYKACWDAYNTKRALVVTGEGGFGKTSGLHQFKKDIEKKRGFRVYYYDASMYSSPKKFIVGLMEVLGCLKTGIITSQIVTIKETLTRHDCLLMIDEVSSLEGRNVTVIKNLMTALRDVCGVVMTGTPYFLHNINRGAAADRYLFSETKDRLFMLPRTLNAPSDEEAEAIFKANGIEGAALEIAMGRNPKMINYSFRAKPTFRGIADCIVMIRNMIRKVDYGHKTLEVL